MTNRPLVATMIGDPCGVGPEVIAKAWASGEVHRYSRPVLIGSQYAMEQGADIAGLDVSVRKVSSLDALHDSPDIIDIIDTGRLAPDEITLGQNNAACGRASADWLDEADRLARKGDVAATIMGPISSEAMKMGGVIDKVISPQPGKSYLFLLTGPLRVVHLTDHMPLRQVCDVVSSDLVFGALSLINESLKTWGIARPRIGVAGLNPHAVGAEDDAEIRPGVARAQEAGIDVDGPIAPDTVFRRCIEERYDVVLAMYHDQGHIAVKTWGFVGNCVIILGPPYLHMSVAHGTAHDIVGKGIANHEMILTAMKMAGSLASGKGFLQENKGGN